MEKLIRISHIVTRFHKGSGMVKEGVYEIGTFTKENWEAVYARHPYHGFILTEVVEPTFAEIKFDSEDGSKYYIIRTQKELDDIKEVKELAEKLAAEKLAAEKAKVSSFIDEEESRIERIKTDFKSVVAISDRDSAKVWKLLGLTYVEQWKTCTDGSGHVVPILDYDETIFKS